MPRRRPLPDDLLHSAFTRRTARSLGIPDDRLRRHDVVKLLPGVYATRTLVEETAPDRRHLIAASALVRDTPGTWVSHTTAAQLRDLWLPPRLAQETAVHLSSHASRDTRVQRRGVVGHRCAVRDQDVVLEGAHMLSSPARNWIELAADCSIRQLVVLGDQLVRTPYLRHEGRSLPHTGRDQLHDIVDVASGTPGLRRARAALRWIREGSDSPPETLLRLALIREGLPEPQLQVPAAAEVPGSPRADLGYPAWRIAIQYEGATHYTPEQHRSDHVRDNAFFADGWLVLRFDRSDLRDGFRRAAQQVRGALRARGAPT
ncbi:endonuclease domain-containing protein [Nesterenkonia suensis]